MLNFIFRSQSSFSGYLLHIFVIVMNNFMWWGGVGKTSTNKIKVKVYACPNKMSNK